ncbi:hypothetical protein C1H46_006523 [Malus baccata]|uniref:Cystatin domain-containing protein n=1 Tax=Malus baccata TaxID=106549 RepID=A0A540N9Z5_MALBA|nr:hypothetical protein C1H46_006523 [Malus baccata]
MAANDSLAQFPSSAVDAAKKAGEYNKQAKGQNKLAFERVVRGDMQMVAGMNYRLVISAKNKSVADPDVATPAEYEGIVWERTWLHFKQLTSFHRLSKPN